MYPCLASFSLMVVSFTEEILLAMFCCVVLYLWDTRIGHLREWQPSNKPSSARPFLHAG